MLLRIGVVIGMPELTPHSRQALVYKRRTIPAHTYPSPGDLNR
jgi:hypothetical protein